METYPIKKKQIFHSKANDIAKMLSWICQTINPLLEDIRDQKDIELASEEALVNIIKHAYKNKDGKIEIAIISDKKNNVKVIFKDYADPFNPLKQSPKVDITSPLEERKEGGLGVFFLKKKTDDAYYLRENGANILTLIKKSY